MRKFLYATLAIFAPFFKFIYRKRLRVLAFHDVKDKNNFEAQVSFLKKNYNVISSEDLEKHLNGFSLPDYSVLITFDDGDLSVYELGLPVLKEFKAPAVLFVITDLINTTKSFWWKQVENVSLRRGENYQNARREVNRLKKVSETERLEYIVKLPPVFTEQLKSDHLIEFENNNILVGNHSDSHPMFNQCTKGQIIEELLYSKQKFEEFNLCGYKYFAYPNGNWNAVAEKILIENGIQYCFLFDHKVNRKKIYPYRISRIRVNADDRLQEFKVRVSGLHSFYLNGIESIKKWLHK